ncbi:CHAT domain-containing protein [Nonomuraea sp. NPDC050202]|uniref:CHAT domain-containing protein n=1 Tax=Nonomuraea sp. NPDC050202 TaxID=3155035 RepID=UPI0034002616
MEAYEHGLIAARRLAATQLSPGSRLHSLALHGSQFSRAAYALARAGRLTDAVVVLEQNRTRLLSESTGRDAADLGGLDRIGKGRLRRRFSEAAARLRLLELPRPEGAPSITEAEARRARADFDEVVAEIRRLPGYERLLSPPDVADLRLEALPAPVVFLVATVWGGMALAAGAGRAPAVIWLPALDETVVHARVSAYLDVYGDRTSGAAWQAAVDEITQWSWESMIGPVLAALPGEEHLILVPTQLLGLLPLHAAWHGTGARHYACDDVLLTYGANIRLLHREPRPVATVLTVGPPPSTLAPLPYASREIPYVQAAFPRHRALVDEAATVGNVLAEAGRHDVLHLACHGLTHPTEPLDSGLLLAGDQWLTLPRLLTGGALRGRLAVLSACETALAHPQSGDEALTLPGVLLSTGLSGAIGSLWAVPDLSTALLMARFYSLWPGREPSPARALRQAQRWLRDSTNAEKLAAFPGLLGDVFDALPAAARTLWGRARQHAHPYHWAGFVYYGA